MKIRMTACNTSCCRTELKVIETTKSTNKPAFLTCLEIIKHKVAVTSLPNLSDQGAVINPSGRKFDVGLFP